jgi:serine/threonine protein kinase
MSAPEPPLDHAREGTVLSHYRLLSRLGEGAFGEVHAAEDLRLPRRVALKLLSQAHAADASARRRFLDEATAVSALDHPHICLLYEFDEAEGTPFIVMQLVEGEDLGQAVARGPLTETRTREVITAVAASSTAT